MSESQAWRLLGFAAFLNIASNDELQLSEGGVCGFCKKLAKAAETSIRHLDDELLN